jgi:hypothetical protein
MRRTAAQLAEAQKEIAGRMKALPENYLDCRDPGIRHAWMVDNNFHQVPQVKATSSGSLKMLSRIESCGRCGCVKIEFFSVTSGGIEKVSQKYEYPEGYLMPGVPRGVKQSTVVWQENYRRAMQKVARAARGQRETADR